MPNAIRSILLVAGVVACLLARPAVAAGPDPGSAGGAASVRAGRPDPAGPAPTPAAVDRCAEAEGAVDDEARPGPAGLAWRPPGIDLARPGGAGARPAAAAPAAPPPCARAFPIRC